MQYENKGNKYFIKVEKGEEVVAVLTKFCKDHGIMAAKISGIGATNKVTIGFFETATKEYHAKNYTGDYEITNLSGNVANLNEEPVVHLHITLAGADHIALGGHLNSAVISAACEVYLEKLDMELQKKFDEEVGLNLFSLHN